MIPSLGHRHGALPRPFKTALVCAAIACLALLQSGCDAEHTAASGDEKPALVRVQMPVTKSVTDYEYYTGRTEAPYSLDVRSKVNGYLVRWNYTNKNSDPPLKDFNFVVGQEVDRDQVLFKIDPRPYQATYDEAVAQINLAKAQLQLAQADYARALVVSKTPGAISVQDVDKYLAAQSKAEAEVAAQQASAEAALLNLQFTDVKTDIAGVVGRNLLSVGNLVEANTLLTTVVSQDPMYAYFDIDEITLERIMSLMREGKLESARDKSKTDYGKVPVDLGLSAGQDYPYVGYIDFVNNQIDPTTGTLQLRAVIDNPKPKVGPRVFSPGMFLRVRLPIGNAYPALLIPQIAVGTDQSQKYVFVVNAENKIEYRPIKVSEVQSDNLQIAIPQQMIREANGIRLANPGEKGAVPSLTAEDRVVIGGLQRIRPGMTVEIQPSEQK